MLHVVGCRPGLPSSLTDGESAIVTMHGRLDKNVPEQRAAMQNLFIDSHFLIVPTRAECYGIVFAEAHAFGLPPVSRAINSLPSIVLDRKTGILLPNDSPVVLYVNRIQELSTNPAEYQSMSKRALEHYDQVLNWDSAVQKMLTFMQ
jgi:glycosyltransferase involved in cell wall biosynthesis